MRLSSFSLRNLKQRDIALIVIVLTVLGAVAWYFYMYRPTQDEISQLESDIANLHVQIERGEAAQRNLPALRNEVALLEQERVAFLRELPRESEVAALIDQVRVSAAAQNVILEGISQGNVSEQVQDVRPLGFTLNTSGNYVETVGFLRSLERLQRFTKIRQVGLTVASEEGVDDPNLNASFAMTVYVFTGNDPGEQQP